MGAVVRSPEGYIYLDLLRAKSAARQYQNFYGVVTEWDAPRKTRGPDLVCSLFLTDTTLSAGGAGQRVELRCFAPDLHQLPHVRKPGDVIRLHRVRIDTFGDSGVQLIASLGGLEKYNFKRPSFCLFDAVPSPSSNGYQPYQKSSKTYHFDEKEKMIINVLREFSVSNAWRAAVPVDIPANKYRRPIRSLITNSEQRMEFCDLVGLVLSVETVSGGEEDCRPVIWLWDGTDAPPYPPTYDSRRLDISVGEGGDSEGVRSLRHREFLLSYLSPAAAAVLPTLGTALPVVVESQLEMPGPGAWVKLRNAGFLVVEGQLQGYAYTKTRWAQWQPDISLIKDYAFRLKHSSSASAYAPEDAATWIAETRHRNRPLTSLRAIARDVMLAEGMPDQENAVPAAYRCLTRVTKIWPPAERIDDICVPASEVGHAARNEGYTQSGDWMYAARLQLEDGTGSLLVDLFGRSGEEFFGNIAPPQDFRASPPEVRGALVHAVDAMLGVGCEDVRGRWLDLSIACFWPDDGDSARFRVFDSYLKG